LMISDNVEFLPPIFIPYFGSHFENGRYLENFEWKRRIAPLMVTYHYVGKLEISYINVDNF
jgi:hypothetical protein